MAQYQTEEPTVAQMEELKVLVADEQLNMLHLCYLTLSNGLPQKLLIQMQVFSLFDEKTGYDTSTKRLPDCLDVWSAKRR